MLKRFAVLAIALLMVGGLTSGATRVQSQGASNTQRLMPGDRIGIKFFEEDQISGSYLVDAAGTITLPIVGAIKVINLTLADAQKAIEGVLGNGYYTHPVVGVRIDEFRPIYVHGHVKTPGAYPYRTGLTAIGAVVLAGGAPSAAATALALTTELSSAQERVDILVARRAELAVRVAGLEALRGEGNDIDTSIIPDDIQSNRRFAHLLNNERRKFEIETKALDDELNVLRKQQPQFNKEREALEAEIAAQSRLLELSSTRYARLEALKQQGLARTAAIMEPAQQEANAQGSIARLKAQRSRNEIETATVELKIVEKRNAFLQKVTQLLNDARRNLDETDIQLSHARRGLELRRQAAGYGTEPGAPQSFIIQRLVDGQQRTIQGTAWTTVEPGDIIEVRNFDAGLAVNTTEAPHQTSPVTTGSTGTGPRSTPASKTNPIEGGVRYGLVTQPSCVEEGRSGAGCRR